MRLFEKLAFHGVAEFELTTLALPKRSWRQLADLSPRLLLLREPRVPSPGDHRNVCRVTWLSAAMPTTSVQAHLDVVRSLHVILVEEDLPDPERPKRSLLATRDPMEFDEAIRRVDA